MAGSEFGRIIRISTWGESHGPAVGVTLDGFPAGMELSQEDIQVYLDRRKPGQSRIATQRKEEDRVEILSGVFEGKTTGTPIAMMIRNKDQHSADYANIMHTYRPGHADYTYDRKYGFRDYRGGGRSSARETAGRVAAGAVCAKLLSLMGVRLSFYTAAIGDVVISRQRFDPALIGRNATNMPDSVADQEALALIEELMQRKDSAGGVVEGRITGVPAGIGDPVFDRLDACLAKALMSIGAVKAVGIGDGMFAAYLNGSQNNDVFYADDDGIIRKKTNHAGGILGGISDGSDIIVSASIKPTPSIGREQETVTDGKENTLLTIQGRHDPVIVPRAVVVCECMCAITLLDAMLVNMSAKADSVIQFYKH